MSTQRVALTSGLYYKHMTILNDDSSIVNKLGASLTDDTRVIIYNHHMFIVQSTGKQSQFLKDVNNIVLTIFIAFNPSKMQKILFLFCLKRSYSSHNNATILVVIHK
jgi:hypothetical protein